MSLTLNKRDMSAPSNNTQFLVEKILTATLDSIKAEEHFKEVKL